MSNSQILEKIKKDIESNSIILYMKGTPEQPMCGFSAQVVAALKKCGAKFHSVDVLEDYDVREGIKEYTNWPTIPQLYVKGKFIGGCDITMDLFRKGELAKLVSETSV